MKSNFIVLLLFFFTFSSAAIVQGSSDQVSRSYSAKTRVFGNKQVMSYLLDMIEFDASIRLVSKDFKEGHDQYCAYYLSKIDSRLKNYLNDIRLNINDEGYFVSSRILPTLRLEVPLYYLFSKYLKNYCSDISNSPAQIQNREKTAETLRMADVAEGRLFIKRVMRSFNRQVFGPRLQNPNNPKYLLYLYILARSCFDLSEFAQIGFPINALLLEAVKGLYPDPYCEEIVRDFNTNIAPSSAYWAVKSGRVDLARIILNKPGAPDALGYYTDLSSYMNPLHYCACIGAADLIDRCLEMGADPFRFDFTRDYKPMHYAVANGHLEVIKRLFKRDQHVIFSSDSTLSPMLLAAYNRKYDIIEFFLSQPNVTLIRNPILSKEIAEIALNSNDAKLARILWNSKKFELSDEIWADIQMLSSRIEQI